MKSFIQKIVFSIAVVLVTAVSVYAQVPQGFNFQAVARGATGEILADQALGVQVSIIKGTEDGNPIYEETHSITTNPLGLIQLVIGEGTAAEGQIFSEVDFGNDNYYVKLAIDPSGGTEYADLGTTRLLSVPYALVAQKAIDGNGNSTGAITEYNLNTSENDTSFIVNATGTKSISGALKVKSSTDGSNRGVDSRVVSGSGNESSQLGSYGRAEGEGTGSHFGSYGIALGSGGGNNYGTFGWAEGTGKFNFGVQAVARGDGSGEIVPLGEEVDFNFGSYNIAGGFYSSGNLNGNVGVEAQAAGENGSRIDFGVIARAIGTSNSPNIGVRGEAFNSPQQNVALEGEASGSTYNLGLRLNVHSGSSNIGMEVNADTAAILNGHSVINGDLTVNGTINGSGVGGGPTTDYVFDTANPDSTFLINVSGPVSGTGLISTASTSGSNSGIEGKAHSGAGNAEFQVGTYGEATGEGTGTHIAVYGSAVNPEGVGTGGRRYGLYGQARSVGRENIGGFGIGLGAGDGEVIALGDEFASGEFNVGGFNIGLVGFARQNLNGNIGIRGYVYGTEGARENRGVSAEAVTQASGRNIGTQAIVHSSQTKNIGFQALMFDGGTGVTSEDNLGIELDISNSSTSSNKGITANINGASVNNTGLEVNVSGGSSSNIGMIVNATTAAELNGNVYVNGDLNYSGALNNTSDRNLKENIQPLANGIETIMKLNPTTYNFRGDGEYKGLALSRGLHYGLIAQEVEEVLPSLVKDNTHTYLETAEGTGPNNPDEKSEVKVLEYKTMNYTELIPVLIKAVQEQQEEIEKLKKQIEILKKDK